MLEVSVSSCPQFVPGGAWAAWHASSDGHSLLLSAADLPGESVDFCIQAHQAEQLLGAGRVFLASQFLNQEDVFEHRQVLKQVEELEYITDVLPSKRGHFFRVSTGYFAPQESVGAAGWTVQG